MTPQELYESALAKLHVTAAGEDSRPEDVAIVRTRYAEIYGLLNAEELVSWPVEGDIPDEAGIPLVTMLACHAAKEFGVTGAQYQELLAEGGMNLPQASWAERSLRRVMARRYVSTRMETEYF